MPEQYHFVTEWRFRAPLERVWPVVLDIEKYPGWWRNFRKVNVVKGDGKSVGSLIECTVRGSLPYDLRYTIEVVEAELYRRILLRSSGDLIGTGRWQFSKVDVSTTMAVYFWDVSTTNPILNLIAPLAKKALASNHDRVMANGYAALRPYVEAAPKT